MPEKDIYLKRIIWKILEERGLKELSEALEPYAPTRVVSPLIGAFLHPSEEVRWKAIFAFGFITAKIAERELERARVIIRRLMWMLNEESGSMAWGVGEGFAEALYHSEALKKEYLQIYVSYIWPEGNYLEFPPAQRGVIWGVGRLAQKYQEDLLKISAPEYLVYHLGSPDPMVVFFSLWSLSFFQPLVEIDKVILQRALEFISDKVPSQLLFDGETLRILTPEDIKGLYRN